MIYFIGTLLELYKKLEVFIEHSKSTGFLYNDISYGSDFYTGDFISDNQNEIDIYNQNDPFQLFNDIQLVELNVLKCKKKTKRKYTKRKNIDKKED